jgi:hypothetical protein
MKREYYFYRKCTDNNCKEQQRFSYSTRAEEKQGIERNKTWTCIRHQNPEQLITPNNTKTSVLIKCIKKNDHNYWQNEKHFGTDNCSSGFQHGNGYKVFAKDFPVGTVIRVTAEVIKK